ncbi:MAG: hypothetical protein ACMUHB_00540 [Thermoplasmatota archaeon]
MKGRRGRKITVLLLFLHVVLVGVAAGEEEEDMNHDPTPIMSSPGEDLRYYDTDPVVFDGSESFDPDNDDLNYLWYSDRDGYLGTDPVIVKYLSQGNHLITLHVSDGLSNISISRAIKVIPDITRLDTDKDGAPDISDTDDDNDGLPDIEEDINLNGILDQGETDRLNPDTDGDGINDKLDPYPLYPGSPPPPDDEGLSRVDYMFYILVAGWVLFAFFITGVIGVALIKRILK